MALLDLETSENDGTATIALSGELDISTATKVEEELARLERDARPGTIVIDLRGLEFMDSTGLRVLVAADQRARDEERRLAIVRGPDAVQRIFQMTRLDERLELVDEPV